MSFSKDTSIAIYFRLSWQQPHRFKQQSLVSLAIAQGQQPPRRLEFSLTRKEQSAQAFCKCINSPATFCVSPSRDWTQHDKYSSDQLPLFALEASFRGGENNQTLSSGILMRPNRSTTTPLNTVEPTTTKNVSSSLIRRVLNSIDHR